MDDWSGERGVDQFVDEWELNEVDSRFEQLSAYLDGELSAVEARQVEGWLTEDPDLRQMYVQLSSLQAGFERLQVAPASNVDNLVAQVWAQVSLPDSAISHASHRHQRRWGRQISSVAAGLALLVGSSVVIWQGMRPQPLVSLEDPPVTIARIPPSTLQAERYLFQPETSQDAYLILFDEGSN
ncbi:MAG: anti-sigma factor family protein [Cyanophyceae cyanobacterium]